MSSYSSQNTRQSIEAYLRDPSSFPLEFKQWLIAYLSVNPPYLTFNQIAGTSAALSSIPDSRPAFASGISVAAANTDLPWTYKDATVTTLYITTGGGTLRSLASPLRAGQRVVIRNSSASNFTILNAAGGGSGLEFFNVSQQNLLLFPGSAAEYMMDGISGWIQIGNIAQPFARLEAGRGTYGAGSTAVGFSRSFSAGMVPAVTITSEIGVGVAQPLTIFSPSATGFTMVNGTGSSQPIAWIAVGY